MIKKNPEEVIVQFAGLDRALVDASSLIYMDKAGFLDLLAGRLELVTIPEIVEETGFSRAGIGLVEGVVRGGSNDEKLMACARELGVALVSEDRKILLTMDREGVPYFNALMMLCFLLYRGELGRGGYSVFLNRLVSFAWYSEGVLEFGKEIFQAIDRGI